MLKRIWRTLPLDGLGLRAGPDPAAWQMRRWAAREWRRAFPLPLRPLAWALDRVGSTLAVVWPTLMFARARGLRAGRTARLYRDCVGSGAGPVDAYVWREIRGEPHPLPPRSAALLLSRLGDPAAHALLTDKLALQRTLAGPELIFPAIKAVLGRGAPVDLDALPGPGAALFLKLRHGHGGQDAFPLAFCDGVWATAAGRVVTPAALQDRLMRMTRNDDVLVQSRLRSSAALDDLAVEERAPVLRLATARRPGAAPFIQSALLSIPVPGRSPRDFLRGSVHAPIDLATGRLAAGLSLFAPRRRLDRLGSAGPILSGRAVPGVGEAGAMGLRAMSALPPLPLVHWDFILTDNGPVMLEGNSGGNWILACLPDVDGLQAEPLMPLLSCWLGAQTR